MNEWTNTTKLITENHETVARDIAEFCKNSSGIWLCGWRDFDVDKIADLLYKDDRVREFLEAVQPGDKVEATVWYRDPLAASGGWQIVRNGEVVKSCNCWVA